MVKFTYSSDFDGELLTYLSNNDIIKSEEAEEIVKAGRANLVPVKVEVTRNGKTFLQTFWKTPYEAKKLLRERKAKKPEKDFPHYNFTKDEGVINGFQAAVTKAKNSCPPRMAWRVADDHKAEDYKKSDSKVVVTKGGSTIAVANDGDIISVCKHKGDTLTGTDLLHLAVKNGGTKLDSFAGNYKFYCKNGFEPVSWCEFDEEFAPPGWDKSLDEAEPIIFFKYTGKEFTVDKDTWLHSVDASVGDEKKCAYDKAMDARNDSMKN